MYICLSVWGEKVNQWYIWHDVHTSWQIYSIKCYRKIQEQKAVIWDVYACVRVCVGGCVRANNGEEWGACDISVEMTRKNEIGQCLLEWALAEDTDHQHVQGRIKGLEIKRDA